MTTESKSIEQLRADAEAAAEQLRAAERAAKEAEAERQAAERAAKLKEQTDRRDAERAAIRVNLHAEMKAADVLNEWTERKVGVIEHYKSNGSYTFRSTFAGYVIIVTNTEGKDRRFPANAKGSYNFTKIVAYVKEVLGHKIAQERAKIERNARVNKSNELCGKLAAEFGPNHVESKHQYALQNGRYGRSEYRESLPKEGNVFVRFHNLDCNEEQARIMLEAYNRAFPKKV